MKLTKKQQEELGLKTQLGEIEYFFFDLLGKNETTDNNDLCRIIAEAYFEMCIETLKWAKKSDINEVMKHQKALLKVVKQGLK